MPTDFRRAFRTPIIGELISKLAAETGFYQHGLDTLEECRARVMFLKEEIENNGAYRLFYHKGEPIQREQDLQILFGLTWFATPSDFNSEVNNGSGPVDFVISRGSKDKTFVVEFELGEELEAPAKSGESGQGVRGC